MKKIAAERDTERSIVVGIDAGREVKAEWRKP
jgi:hypothetical protein